MPYKDPAMAKAHAQLPEIKKQHNDRARESRNRPDVRERINKQKREYSQRPEVKEHRLKYTKEHRIKPGVKELARDRELQKKYGITLAEFNTMITGQGMSCAICKSSDWGPYGPTVDHEHGPSGRVRGILCSKCNLAIGQLRDSPLIARAIASYLESNQGETNETTD